MVLAVVLSVDVKKLQSEKNLKSWGFFSNKDGNFVGSIKGSYKMFAFTLCLFITDIFLPFHFFSCEAIRLKFY